MTDEPEPPRDDEPGEDEENAEFDRFEALTKKLLRVDQEPEDQGDPDGDTAGT